MVDERAVVEVIFRWIADAPASAGLMESANGEFHHPVAAQRIRRHQPTSTVRSAEWLEPWRQWPMTAHVANGLARAITPRMTDELCPEVGINAASVGRADG